MDIQTLLRAWAMGVAINRAPNGWPRQSAFAKEMGKGNIGMPPLPDEEQQRIDRIVSDLKIPRPDFYEVICLSYISGLSDVKISRRLKCNRWQAREKRVAAEAYLEAKLDY